MVDIENKPGTFIDNLDIRIEVVEAHFENKSDNITDVVIDVVDIQGVNVPSESWSNDVTLKINAIRKCLINSGLMKSVPVVAS